MLRNLIFIISAVLAIGACSKGGSRIKINKTLTADNKDGTATELDKKLSKATESGDCLNIYEVSKALLAAKNDIFSTYTSAVGLGASNEETHKSFRLIDDPYLNAFILKNNPPVHEALLGSELTMSFPGGLLNISEQKECQSVTILNSSNKPIEYQIIASDSKVLILKDSGSKMVLRYSKPTNGELKIITYFPLTLPDCSNTEHDLVQRIEHKFTWGGGLESVQLDGTYAVALKNVLPVTLQELNDAISSNQTDTTGETSGKATTRQEYKKPTFEISYPTYAKIQDLIKNSDLNGSKCEKP